MNNISKQYWKILETITEQYLNEHPNEIFVFGDNTLRKGNGGAAKLRHCKNTYGFITKKFPNTNDSAYYRPDEYKNIFIKEFVTLCVTIMAYPNKIYLISPVGSGLANKYNIWEEVIEPHLKHLQSFPNVRFLY